VTDADYDEGYWDDTVDGKGYVWAQEDEYWGTFGTLTQAEALEFEGYEAQPFEQFIIDGDDGYIYIYYNRISYNVSVNRDIEHSKGITNVTGEGSYKWGNPATVEITMADGYTFGGWEGIEGAGTTYTFTMPMNDVELTPNIKTTNYTITYNLDGGTVAGNPTTYTVETESFTLKDPTRTGYTFLGWIGTNIAEITETVTITKGSTGNLEFTAIWGASITVETTGASGKTFEVQVFEGSASEEPTETHTSTFILQTRKNYTIKVAVSNLIANSTTNEYEIVRMSITGGAKPTVDSSGATTFNKELLTDAELLEAKTISIEYISAYKLTVSQPSSSIVGFGITGVNSGENVIIPYSNEYIIANNTVLEFTIDSTPINLKAPYTYTGFIYNAGNGNVQASEDGDKVVVLEKFDVNSTLGDRNVGTRTFKVAEGTKLQSIAITAVQSVVIDLTNDIITSGTVELRDNKTGFIKVIDVSTTKIILYAETWEIVGNSANLSVDQLAKLFDGYTVSSDGKTLTIS